MKKINLAFSSHILLNLIKKGFAHTLAFCYTRLCARYSMKEAITIFFQVKRSKENHENTICMNF